MLADAGRARRRRGFHERVLRLAHRRLVAVRADDHVLVVGELDLGVRQAVPDGQAFELFLEGPVPEEP